MSTFTAQILIGQKHSYDSGIINITHSLYLSENNRPAWLLRPTNLFSEQQEPIQNIIWVPTLENMLEDTLVMAGLYVLKDKELDSLANQYSEIAEKIISNYTGYQTGTPAGIIQARPANRRFP